MSTVGECGWKGRKSGELLKLAQEQFDVFVTADRNLAFQQHVPQFEIAVVVLHAPTNTIESLSPLIPEVLRSLELLRKGQIVRIGQ